MDLENAHPSITELLNNFVKVKVEKPQQQFLMSL